MKLKRVWDKYADETKFNFSIISEFLDEFGKEMVLKPDTVIVSRGDFPTHVYFIKEGVATGLRDYEDGKDYNYFQVDQTNGNIGLLEVISRREKYIATITCLTKVTLIKVDSAMVYQLIMSDISLLRRCSVLLAEDLYSRSGNDGLFYHYQGIDRVRYYLTRYYEDKAMKQATDSIYIGDYYKDIASQTGISLRTVGRSIQKLKALDEITDLNRKLMMTKQQYIKMKQHIWVNEDKL